MFQLIAVLLWNEAPHSVQAGAPTFPGVLAARTRFGGLQVHYRPFGMGFTRTFHDWSGPLLLRTGPERERESRGNVRCLSFRSRTVGTWWGRRQNPGSQSASAVFSGCRYYWVKLMLRSSSRFLLIWMCYDTCSCVLAWVHRCFGLKRRIVQPLSLIKRILSYRLPV